MGNWGIVCVPRTKMVGDLACNIDDSPATFKLDVEYDPDSDEWTDDQRLHRNYADAIGSIKNVKPSAQLVLRKMKFFDDRLYAAIETNLETGLGTVREGKLGFLKKVFLELANFWENHLGFARTVAEEAVVYLGTGLRLRGYADVPEELKEEVKLRTDSFIQQKTKSKPIGFYDTTETLRSVFASDRFFQERLRISSHLETGAALLISHVIMMNKELYHDHAAILRAYSKITSPVDSLFPEDYFVVLKSHGSIEEVLSSVDALKAFIEGLHHSEAYRKAIEKLTWHTDPDEHVGLALFPHSQSLDMEQVLSSHQLSKHESLAEALVERINTGELNLEPSPNSGWYDYQLHALETLIAPDKTLEKDKLLYTWAYQEHLKDTFLGALTGVKETHVKQMGGYLLEKEMPEKERPKIEVSPELSVEPTITSYLKMAEAYRFIKSSIAEVLGEDALATIHGLSVDGLTSHKSLRDELDDTMSLSYGLYLRGCIDLGLTPVVGRIDESWMAATSKRAEQWLSNFRDDEDLKCDTRVIVPLIAYPDGNLLCWANLGVRLLRVTVKYREKPKVTLVVGGEEKEPEDVGFEVVFSESTYWIPVEVFTEVIVNGDPLTREEFREICDHHSSKQAIMKELRTWYADKTAD